MNHITARMLSDSIHRERLADARRRRDARVARSGKPSRRPSLAGLADMVRAYLAGFRTPKPQPSR